MVFDQSEIEEAVISHFATIFKGQRVPVFPVAVNQSTQIELAAREMETTAC